MTTKNLETKKLILKKIFMNFAKQHNPEYNEDKMIELMESTADNLINDMITLRNDIIEKDGDKILDDYKKERNKKENQGLIIGFLLNKNKKYNTEMQELITIELDNEIFREVIDADEKNYQIAPYIPELEHKKIQAKYMQSVIDFSGQAHRLQKDKKSKNNFNKSKIS